MNITQSPVRVAVLVLATAVTLPAASAGPATSSNAAPAFEKMKTLVGQWEAPTQNGKAYATYELLAAGTAILERYVDKGQRTLGPMITLYHLDGERLVLAHYCIAGNQPRMQALPMDPASNEIAFEFIGAGNLPDANAGHMHEATFTFEGPDRFTTAWTWFEQGQSKYVERLTFTRAKAGTPTSDAAR